MQRWRGFPRTIVTALLLLTAQGRALSSPIQQTENAALVEPLDVVVSEIAWMGTTTSSSDEWIELYNNTVTTVNLTGWTLSATDGTPTIALSGQIPPRSHFLLERTDDSTVTDVEADLIYSGGLENAGEALTLHDGATVAIDRITCDAGWFSGHDRARVPMMRVDTRSSGEEAANWTYNPRCGTATNSQGISHTCHLTVTHVGHSITLTPSFNPRFGASFTSTTPTAMEEALLTLIDGASVRVEVALYGLNRQSVIEGLIAAHNRGVDVRVVGDDEAASGTYHDGYQALIHAGLTVITDSHSAIQHNKFLIVDGEMVWTGSTNLTDTGLTLNANNAIIIQDTTLAALYHSEFDEMWQGDFHGAKTDNTAHILDHAGTRVESYFSPTDLVAFEVRDELAQADETVHFAMFFWTDELLTDMALERLEGGVAFYGVWDELGASNSSSADGALCAAGAQIGVESWNGKLHHKFAIIDVHGTDPVVILGSYNWTDSGAYDNDENTLVIHDAALAQAYHEEWQRLWSAMELSRICNPPTSFLPLILAAYPSMSP
jgi:phosphatidylserine/phosphatidylglycerophosphate/cardiolipin synthase-like enzyme